MDTKEIASKLVEYCRKADFESAQKELFSKDAVSIEPYASADFEKETSGLDKILEKGTKFMEMVHEIHSIEISEPLVAHEGFAVALKMDVTMKGKQRMNMSEICLYKLKDGKIISEEFFV